jgi:hypothetical protein
MMPEHELTPDQEEKVKKLSCMRPLPNGLAHVALLRT